MMGHGSFFGVYHKGMEILPIFFLTLAFSVVYVILNAIFGFSDDNYVVYYEREVRYEEPPF